MERRHGDIGSNSQPKDSKGFNKLLQRELYTGHNSEASLKALKPFIELRSTEELNKNLSAFDEHIQQLGHQNDKLVEKAMTYFSYKDLKAMKTYDAMMEEPRKIDEQIVQLQEQRELYWEVLKERGQKGQLQPENRAYYDQQRKIELSETHESETRRMKEQHEAARDKFIQKDLKKEPYKYAGASISWETMNDRVYPHLKNQFLEDRHPQFLREQQQAKAQLQKRHEMQMNELEQEL
jgi:hypothetical protein